MRQSDCHAGRKHYARGYCHACYVRLRTSGALQATRARLVHGHSVDAREFGVSATYQSWSAMKFRCENPKANNYHLYGGRGIQVCQEWRSDFPAFLRDVGMRPSINHSIDRIDNNGDYKPGNVRWATQSEQNFNKSNNHTVSVDDKALAISQWAQILKTHPATITNRIRRGWSERKAVTTPVRKYREH